MTRFQRKLQIIAALLFLLIIYGIAFTALLREENQYSDELSGEVSRKENDWHITREMKLVESENSRRLEKIESVCRKYGIGIYKNSQNPPITKHPPTPQYQVFYFDRSHKLSLCPIYKAGSTTWLYHLLTLVGMTEQEITDSGKQLSELARERYPEVEPSDAEELLQTTVKIMTVRHPFERILSAYRDKLENINHGWEHGTKHFYQAYGEKIVKKYRAGGSQVLSSDILSPKDVLRNPELPQPAGVEPTFQEFVRYLLDSNLVSQADDHWIPYYLYCTPCLLKYEFVAKTETLDRDQMYIIHSLGLEDQIKPRWNHRTQFNATDNLSAVSSVSRIYFRQLTTNQIQNLYEKYKIDFELFGYHFAPYLKYAKNV